MPEEHTSSADTMPHESEHAKPGFMNPDITLLILTWVTFFALFFVLRKYAWKPILDALENREKAIRQAIEDADRVKEELAKINQTREEIFSEAQVKAKEIVEHARKAAVEASKVIEEKAKHEAQIMIENALREIKAENEKAQAILKQQTSDIVIALAGKLINENLDVEKNRKLLHQLIKEI